VKSDWPTTKSALGLLPPNEEAPTKPRTRLLLKSLTYKVPNKLNESEVGPINFRSLSPEVQSVKES